MSAALTLAKPEHLNSLTALVAAFHAEENITMSDEALTAGISPLLDGIPHGAAYLIGPPRAPIGYIVITFGWSLEFGGMDGFIDEFFVRPGVRGRGVGSEVLVSLLPQMDAAGVHALHLEAARDRPRLERLYSRAGFRLREGYHLMTRLARKR